MTTRPAGPAHPRTGAAATAGSARAEHRQCTGIAARTAGTTGTERRCRGAARTPGTAEPVDQPAPTAVAAGSADQPGNTSASGAAIAEQSGRAAVTAVEPSSAGAEQQTTVTPRAGVAAGAGGGIPGVAVTDQQSGVGMLGGAVTDENADEVRDRVRTDGCRHGQPGGSRCRRPDGRGRRCRSNGAAEIAPGERRNGPDHRRGRRLAAAVTAQPGQNPGTRPDRSSGRRGEGRNGLGRCRDDDLWSGIGRAGSRSRYPIGAQAGRVRRNPRRNVATTRIRCHDSHRLSALRRVPGRRRIGRLTWKPHCRRASPGRVGIDVTGAADGLICIRESSQNSCATALFRWTATGRRGGPGTPSGGTRRLRCRAVGC